MKEFAPTPEFPAREAGLGPGSAGQSGDTQGLSDDAEAGSESVVELIEEGQSSRPKRLAAWKMLPTRTWLKCTRNKSQRMTCPPNTWEKSQTEFVARV